MERKKRSSELELQKIAPAIFNEGSALDASWMNNEHCKVDKNKVSDNTFGGKQLAEDE